MYGLGFRYALDDVPIVIRRQLSDPDTELVTLPVVIDPHSEVDSPRLLIVREPSDLRSLAVSMGGYQAFLPAPGDSGSFFTDIAPVLRRRFNGESVDLSGTLVSDEAPAFLLDHHPDALDGVTLAREA